MHRFQREAEAAARLSHPNLVAALDADEVQGLHFLVRDYVEGSDLGRVVREQGPMPVGRAVDCIVQAARGLEAAHTRGIIHRDIKPSNLLLDAGGTVKVLDLGLARIIDPFGPGGAEAAELTRSGTIMGTVDFIAPEQAYNSKSADHRADIYSLGCTLSYLLTARPPFGGETLMERLLAHREQPLPALRDARPDVPPALEAVWRRMLAKARRRTATSRWPR